MAKRDDVHGSLFTAATARRRRTPGKAAALAVAVLMMGLLGAGAEVAPAEVAPTEAPHAEATAQASPRGYFEPNHGQFPDHVRFVVHGAGTNAFLTDGGATFVLEENPTELPADPLADPILDDVPATPASLFAVQLRFEDAHPGTMEGTERRQGISNHFIGNDPDKWVTGVPNYGRVVQRDVWPGIDIEWHISPEGLKFDAVVHPGADAGQVRFTLPGAEGLRLDAKGDLRVATPLGALVKEAPYTYQGTKEGLREVPSRYVLEGGAVGFDIGDHDPSKTLVIDPLIYSTYYGSASEGGRSIVVDAEGNAYIIIQRADLPVFPPTAGPHGPLSTYNVLVIKLAPAGDEIVFSTYLGGGSQDAGMGITVDADRNIHLTGWTQASNFPTTSNAYSRTHAGGYDIFITKLSPDASTLLYSTYLGGSGIDFANGVAVDTEGQTYVTGQTSSVDFPTTPLAAQMGYAGGDAGSVFLTKLNTTASGEDSLVYSTHLGGSPQPSHPVTGYRSGEMGTGVVVDSEGHAYVTGTSDMGAIPTTANAFQGSFPGGSSAAFVTKFTPEGDGIVYSTYLGGSSFNHGSGIAIDGMGNAYLAGSTTSDDFPTGANTPTEAQAPTFEPDLPGSQAVFITKLNPSGSGLVYSTFVAETLTPVSSKVDRYGPGVAVDGQGQAFVSGWTRSDDFPTKNAFQDERRGGTDVFVAAFQPDGSELVWGTYIGGSGGSEGDRAKAIAVDASGSVYITGKTTSQDFPTHNAIQYEKESGPNNIVAFVAKLYGVMPAFDWSPDPPCPGEPVRFRDLSISLSGITGTEQDLARSEWDFGDGSNAITLRPWQNVVTHTYPPQAFLEDRSYNVTLRATDVHGATAVATHVVEVPWCPPPNHAPVLKTMPCIIASPEQKLSFQVHASVPVFPDDPSSYSELRFFAEGLPSGATFQQDGDFSARFMWEVGPPDTYTFVVHVEDGGLPEHGVASFSDSKEYCVEVRPEKSAPGRDDSSGDGVQNWHDACPHLKSPDQGDAGGGLDDPCDPAAPPEPEETPEQQGPPPGGCPSQPAGPREVTARWTDGAVQITWQSDSWCPPDHFLVWNGTGHHLVDFVPAEAGVHHVVLNLDPWPEPHQYFVQAMGADEGLFFDPTRAVGSNLIDPAGCVLEGARSEACLPRGIGEEPPAAVEPAAPEAAAPADGAPLGLIAAAVALVVGGLMALLWRLRHAPWVVHLFTRLGQEDVLGHPVRKQIMTLVTARPGIHYKEILRQIGKGRSVTLHHLQVLATAGKVLERRSGRYLCYYPPQGPGPGLHEAGGLLRADVAKRLLGLLLEAPGLPVAELARRLGAHPTTVRYHLRRFEKKELARLDRQDAAARVFPGSLSQEALDLASRGVE